MNQGLRRAGLAFAAALCVSGCASNVLGKLVGSRPDTPVGNRVDPALAAALSTAAAGAETAYTRPDGAKITLTLGAPYNSARGVSCRIGRDDADQMEYGFCRSGADWLAVPPRAITGR
jgi:hypothetical protein